MDLLCLKAFGLVSAVGVSDAPQIYDKHHIHWLSLCPAFNSFPFLFLANKGRVPEKNPEKVMSFVKPGRTVKSQTSILEKCFFFSEHVESS